LGFEPDGFLPEAALTLTDTLPNSSRYSDLLRGDSLTLRRVTADAIPGRYLEFLRDPEVVKYLQARFTDHTPQSLKGFVAGFDHVDNFLFGVYAGSDTFIGTATLRVNPVHRFSNLGYMIGDRAFWKGSISIEMCQLILDFAFFERGVRKILECTTENHLASNFNFKRLGFSLVAKIPDLYWGEGRYQAATYWSLDAAQWAARRGREAPAIPPPPRP
jgi:RimJ/RimL family protein N-acetyltransferase